MITSTRAYLSFLSPDITSICKLWSSCCSALSTTNWVFFSSAYDFLPCWKTSCSYLHLLGYSYRSEGWMALLSPAECYGLPKYDHREWLGTIRDHNLECSCGSSIVLCHCRSRHQGRCYVISTDDLPLLSSNITRITNSQSTSDYDLYCTAESTSLVFCNETAMWLGNTFPRSNRQMFSCRVGRSIWS